MSPLLLLAVGLVLLQDPAVPPVVAPLDARYALWTLIIGFLATLATQVFQLYRESRNRKWDLDDRQRTEQKLDVNTNASQRAAKSAADAAAKLDAIDAKLDAVTSTQPGEPS